MVAWNNMPPFRFGEVLIPIKHDFQIMCKDNRVSWTVKGIETRRKHINWMHFQINKRLEKIAQFYKKSSLSLPDSIRAQEISTQFPFLWHMFFYIYIDNLPVSTSI